MPKSTRQHIRLVPSSGPMDYPASHWGEVVHTVGNQVNHTKKVHTPPIEECNSPGARRCLWGMPVNLVHTQLLHLLRLFNARTPTRCPKGDCDVSAALRLPHYILRMKYRVNETSFAQSN